MNVRLVLSLSAFAAGSWLLPAAASDVRLSGAIFTTTVDGTVVNENVHYQAKEDVYLDGGPGPNAPAKAAGLPAGDYYFQVTDPSGKVLLSRDHISCRRIRINEFGVIDHVYPGLNWVRANGSWKQVPFQHNQGVDADHFELNAITVQLVPYDDTPNNGGVYKVWMTRTEDYTGDPYFVPTKPHDLVNGANYQPGNYHGFVPARSKTDNFKVKGRRCDPAIVIRKFHDKDFDGLLEDGESEVTGWEVSVTDTLGVTNVYYTPATVTAPVPGAYVVVESTPAGTVETVAIRDGTIVSQYPAADPQVTVNVVQCESHEIVFGDAGVGTLIACKVYDQDGDGIVDSGEPGVPGWKVEVVGTTVTGAPVGPLTGITGPTGCVEFAGLLPGTYTVTEIMPPGGNWVATGPTSWPVVIESTLSGAVISGSLENATFLNICKGTANFDTKGYWHNKNGLAEITPADIAFVNALTPYSAPSTYFESGDEPFDGLFADGTPVAASKGVLGEDLAPAGSTLSEISQFLVESNGGGDPREQLAQQLLAFIFNCRHRLDGPAATIRLPDGTWVPASSLIARAIAAWVSGSAEEQHAVECLLDALNNSDAVEFIHFLPCEVVYP